ncbi:MAG: 30S ribosomal protein S12 methylthiotransferase RimO [Methylocystaceae bacterium]
MQIGFISLGCPKNQVDTEIMMGALSKEHSITQKLNEADVVVINTCGFIEAAKQEAIATILDTAGKLSAEQILLVTGCLAERYGGDLLQEMPEIDGLMGVGNPRRISELVALVQSGNRPRLLEEQSNIFREEGPRIISTPHGWAYLKIAEGCNNRCSYCAIPGIRGNLRCRGPQSILEEAHHLAEQGCRELVLVAQDTTAYQCDGYDLASLLAELNQIEGLEWIRVLYAHPQQLNTRIIEALAGNHKVIPYLDLPIQHSDNDLLKSMNRHYNRDQLIKLITQLRETLPGIVLRTTVMVGFPGESDAQFEVLKDFILATRFNWLGVFAYCQEEGTASAAMTDNIAPEIKHYRVHEIELLQQKITTGWLKGMLGTVQSVLLEAPWRNGIRGHASFQAPEIDSKVLIPYTQSAQYGSIVQVRMKKLRGVDLIGEIDI